MRITGGEFRSRRLVAPRTTATRPTQDRVREALFSILTARGVFGGAPAVVLDLYAGTGALGLEALSRGAARAVFVEKARDALEALSTNVKTLGVGAQVTLLRVPAERAVLDPSRLGGPFDLVFLDPPYADLQAALALLPALVPQLSASGTLVLEHSAADTPGEPPGLCLENTRTYGDTSLSIYVTSAQT